MSGHLKLLLLYPQFRQWLARKREHDPENRFSSLWIEKVERFFAAGQPFL